MNDLELLTRWRLCLGKTAEEHGISLQPGDGDAALTEEVLGFVYESDGEGGGSEPSRLTVPRWVDAVSELFPREAKEVLERE
ncbi:MAG: hypothetical protein KC621_17250, partial [Myxococcales bacterium]|nr:hypothetical protein [Myxococcales bacterium]